MNEDDIVKDDLSEEGLGDIIKEQDRKLKERYDEINYRNNRLRQRQERQRALDNRGLTDDQIREKIKEQDAQRAKENLPSQSPQERRKQQRDMEEGDYLQDPEINPLRFGAGLLVEIFGNIGLDALQAASTLTGPAGLTATTALQSGGSAFFNYLNQKIRGEKNINEGEMAAASAASLIPGLAPFKAATRAGRFYKGVLRGGTTGAIDVTGTKLGRGEEVTTGDLTAGFVGGGLISSAFYSRDSGEAFKALKNKINQGTAFIDSQVNLDGTISRRIVPEEPLEPATFLKSTSDTSGTGGTLIKVPEPSAENASDYLRRMNTDFQFKSKGTLLGKLVNKDEALEIAENLLTHVDEGEKGLIPGWRASRPTTRYNGKRTIDYTRSDGKESKLYLNYSASKNSIVAIDYLKRLETKIARDSWNVNSDSSLGKIADNIWKGAKRKNKDLRALLKQLETDNPEEFRRIFGTKGVWYVEHLHAQNSPFWNKVRPFSPRDPKNLMALGERNFPTLKTNLENHMYTDSWQKGAVKKYGTEIYIDYNPEKKTLQLLRADNDLPLYKNGGFIDGDTPQRNWQKALRDAEANIPQGDISDIAPDTDPIVDFTDKITETTATRLPDVGSQPGVPKANIRANLSKEVQDEIAGYEAEIEQARKNIEVYNSQFEAVPIKRGVPTLGSRIVKTKNLTSMPLTGKNSVNSNRQIIVDRLQKIRDLEQTQGSLLDSKPGVTQSTGTGLMTNVQQEVPTVQPDRKVKQKRVKKTKKKEE